MSYAHHRHGYYTLVMCYQGMREPHCEQTNPAHMSTHVCCAAARLGLHRGRSPATSASDRRYEAFIWMTNTCWKMRWTLAAVLQVHMCWHPIYRCDRGQDAASARHAGRTSRPKLGNAIHISVLTPADTVDSRVVSYAPLEEPSRWQPASFRIQDRLVMDRLSY
jgi:hypothetical protein